MHFGVPGRVSLLLVTWPLLCAGARVLTTADLFRVESFGAVIPSPDEKLLAIVRVRGRSTASVHMRDFMDGRDRSDIWIHDTAKTKSQNITRGHADGSGFFAPAWSPDGERLALLSTRGNSISLWEWRRSTGRLRQVSRAIVELSAPVWVSNTDVVCATPPGGEQPWLFDLEIRASLKARTAWPKAWAGTAVTASTLASGPLRAESMPSGRLLRINVVTGKVSTLAAGIFTGISASPNGRRVAAYELAERLRPDPGKQLPNRNYFRYRLTVFEEALKRTVVEVTPEQEAPPGPVVWLADGRLAVRIANVSKRPDWFIVTHDGRDAINATSALKTVPSTVFTTPDGRELLGLSEGKIRRLPDGSPHPEARFGNADTVIHSIAFIDPRALVVRAKTDGKSGLFASDRDAGSLRLIPEPATGTEFRAVLPKSGRAVFTGVTSHGTSLWITALDNATPHPVMTLNGFVKDIAEGVWKSFPYSLSPEGAKQTAWVLFPPDYREGARYPAVVSVYPGLVYNPALPPRAGIQSASPYNMQLLAARGFAVLFPSIPLPPEGRPGDACRETLEGVMPAVEEAVRLGMVDADRLAVMGHSFGGYGTYALITQTHRFKAAIAMGGISNLVSLYGQLDARARYEDDARDRLIFMMFAESGQFRMGGPPWSDMERYVRNSPISYADRVKTPVMIVQGDQDYVPIQQGEEFFTAIFRQNKPALFVRYWGEGHILESPANITDLWKRIYEWLGRYLKTPSSSNAGPTDSR